MWDKIKHFEPHEFDDPDHPGSGEYINRRLLLALDALRAITGWPMIIHSSVGGAVDIEGTHGHSKRSYHLLKHGAKAVDWHFQTDESVRMQIKAVLDAGLFSGIGVYYDWGIRVGFHTDIRPQCDFQVWTRQNGEYVYLIHG